MSKVGEAVVEQIVAANMNGRKVPALLFLPPPPRPSDRQLIGAFLPYFFPISLRASLFPNYASPPTKHRMAFTDAGEKSAPFSVTAASRLRTNTKLLVSVSSIDPLQGEGNRHQGLIRPGKKVLGALELSHASVALIAAPPFDRGGLLRDRQGRSRATWALYPCKPGASCPVRATYSV